MDQTRRLLSAAQVAELLGKSVRTVQRLADSGEIRAEKLPGTTGAYVFDAAVVDDYMEQQREAAS
jgi:excisionase family DNA binding protein